MATLSKLASNRQAFAAIIRSKCGTMVQVRSFQTPYKPGQRIKFFDSICNVHEIPDYKLDLKPLEWRNGQLTSWASIGILILMVPFTSICIFGLVCLLWITWFDYSFAPLAFIGDIHPHFKWENGEQYYKNKFPPFRWAARHTLHVLDARYLFYQEIADALERRKAQKN